MKRNFKLLGLSGLSLLLLTACGTGEVTASSTNGWDQIVYFFAKAIQWLSINGRIGVGIVLFTIVIRTLMMPLYNIQIKSGQKMQDLQPELRELQKRYPGRDTDSRMKLAEESQALYRKYGVNPYDHDSFVGTIADFDGLVSSFDSRFFLEDRDFLVD